MVPSALKVCLTQGTSLAQPVFAYTNPDNNFRNSQTLTIPLILTLDIALNLC